MKQPMTRGLNLLDWVVSIATIGYGVYSESTVWLAGGALGLALAWYNPGKRVKALIERKMARKATPATTPSLADELEALPPAAATESIPVVPAMSFSEGTAFRYGPQYPMANKHNALRGGWWNSYPAVGSKGSTSSVGI